MYVASWEDGWNDLTMSIGLTRHSPDSVWTQDRTTYSQFLSIAAKLPVGHDDTMKTSFDIPCNLWLVVASLLFAGICIIWHRKTAFFENAWYCFTVTSGENCSGSSLNLRLISSFANLLFRSSSLDSIVFFSDWWSFCGKSSWRFNSFICDSNCKRRLVLLTCSHSTYSTSVALSVHTFFP